MGNSESKPPSSVPPSPSSPSREGSQKEKQRNHAVQDHAKRRESWVPHARKDQPPTSMLISSPSTSTSAYQQEAHATLTASPASTHSRHRSVTTGTPKLLPQDSQGSGKALKPDMGGDSSKPRPPSRAATLPPPQASQIVPDARSTPPPSSRPVDVPPIHHNAREDEETFTPSGPIGESPYNIPSNNYHRPPRLPLPIEEEVHTPGSPILATQDLGTTLTENDVDGALPRRTSMLSSTTMDEEDGDNDAFAPEQQHSLAPTVPTALEWKHGGEKVYVTGTFVQWERKFKLHKDKETGVFSATLQLKPGTHHIKFLVDGDMQVSADLPTTVDYTNILVNYIEVVAPLPHVAQQPPVPSAPMPIPGAALTRGQAEPAEEMPSQQTPIVTGRVDDADLEAAQKDAPSDIPTAQAEGHDQQHEHSPSPGSKQEKSKAPPQQTQPRARYTSHIPDFLLDLDKYATPDDQNFQRASRVIVQLPQPPSLPMFLGKSILNGTTPHKDDASVLIMPNHTVLNHLATSSIRNGVLATSGTTRYKRKFLTTIMYKPTSDDG